jgi:hypothetical protein
MSTPSRRNPSVTTMVLGFLALSAIATFFGIGARYGLVAPTAARRAIGAVIGVMFIVTGNFLPKMRPLNTPATEPTSATTAERVAGWILVLVGFADVALFMFAKLEPARAISSIIGIGAIAVIAANWAWLARGVLFGRSQTVGGKTTLYRAPTERRRIMIWLLFAIFYLSATAAVKLFVSDPGASDKVATWMLVAFGVLYSLTAYWNSPRKGPRCASGEPSAPDDSDTI